MIQFEFFLKSLFVIFHSFFITIITAKCFFLFALWIILSALGIDFFNLNYEYEIILYEIHQF